MEHPVKNKTKAQLQKELSELSSSLETIQQSAGILRRDVFSLDLSAQDRNAVVALVDTFINKIL